MKRYAKPSLLTLSLLLSACAVGPDYERPSVTTPTTYKEAEGWKISEPKAVDSDPNWWSIFNDPVLDQLEKDVAVSNQNIAQAEAAWRGAVAAADQANANLFPTVGANAGFSRGQTSASGFGSTGKVSTIGNTYSAGGSLSWTIDVWGKLRERPAGRRPSDRAGRFGQRLFRPARRRRIEAPARRHRRRL
jgi:outer membrane protein TolC